MSGIDDQQRLRRSYLELVDEFVGFRARLEAVDLDRWLRNLDSIRLVIEQASAGRRQRPRPVFIGPWPEESLGARIHTTDDGLLLLINTGTALLADAMARCATILFDGYPDDAAYHTMTVVTAVWDGALSEDVVYAIPYREENAGGIRLLGSFTANYPVCHEYGHAALGHTNDRRVRGLLDVRRRWTSEGALLWSHQQELDADRAALDLMLALGPVDGTSAAVAGAQRYCVLAGVMVHTLQSLIIELPWSQGRFDIGDGHPPPPVRRAATILAADELGLTGAAAAARHFTDWTHRFVRPAVQRAIDMRSTTQ